MAPVEIRPQLLARAQRRGEGPHRDSSSKCGAAKVGLVLQRESVWPRSADRDPRQPRVRMSASQEHNPKRGSSRTRHGGASP
jgi:hypothetical protein